MIFTILHSILTIIFFLSVLNYAVEVKEKNRIKFKKLDTKIIFTHVFFGYLLLRVWGIV